MVQTVERLELPAETYLALEKSAGEIGCKIEEYLHHLLYREKKKEELYEQLEQEYQQLISRDLSRTITAAESQQLETVIARLNMMEELTENYRFREQRALEIDQKFIELERQIDALAEK